jgi:hypothetical protein
MGINLMRKILATAVCLLLMFLCIPVQPPIPAQENLYGGVQSRRYVTTNEVIWFQSTAFPTTAIQVVWGYGVQCKNGTTTPGFPYFYDHGTQSVNAGSGSGFGKFFPCNGYLTFATVEINTIGVGTGVLYQQILIMNQMPGGGGMIAGSGIQDPKNIEHCLLGVNTSAFFTYSWPEVGCYSPSSGPGFNNTVTVTNPAAGSNFSSVQSTLVRTRIINIQYTLTTSAAAGNRFACVNFVIAVAGTIGQACSPYAQQPSQTVTYEFGAGIGWATNCSFLGATQTAVLCADVMVPLPSWWETTAAAELPNPGFTISSAILASSGVSGIQAADQISGIALRVVTWPETD